MSFRSKLIEKAALEMFDNLPPRPPELEARVTSPRTVQCRRFLAVCDTVLTLPLGDGFEQFKPGLRRILEDMALRCEFAGPEGEKQRAWADDFVARLQAAVGRT